MNILILWGWGGGAVTENPIFRKGMRGSQKYICLKREGVWGLGQFQDLKGGGGVFLREELIP